MSQQDRFGSILSSLHEAALDEALWPAASGLIDEVCGLRGNTLIMARGRSQIDGDIFFVRTCRRGERIEDWERAYFKDYYPTDEQVPRVAQLPDSRLVPVFSLYTAEERKTSPTYNEALPSAGYQNGLNVRMDGPEGSSIFWALADSTSPEGWDSGQIEMIESLLSHLRHFLRVRYALGGAQALNTKLSELIDDTPLGVIHLDRRGRVIEANDRALGLLRRGRGLFEHGGFLLARAPKDDARLQELVTGALPRLGSEARGGSTTISRLSASTREVVHALPVADHQRTFGIGRAAVLVVVVEPGSPGHLNAELVASSLGLTETEGQVATAIALGMTPGQIAKDRGNKLSTIRFHVKRVHAKLGLSRHGDLIRLVLSLGDAPGNRS